MIRIPALLLLATALIAMVPVILFARYISAIRPVPGASGSPIKLNFTYVNDPTLYTSTQIGHGNPFAIVILARDIRHLMFLATELDKTVMESDLRVKHDLSHGLRLLSVVAERCEANLHGYVKKTTEYIDKIVSFSTYSILLAQSPPSIWFKTRGFLLSLLRNDDQRNVTGNHPLLDAVSTTVKMYSVLHQNFTPQSHKIYHLLDVLDAYLHDVTITLSKEISKEDRERVIDDDWTVIGYRYKDNPVDVALRDRVVDLARRLKLSVYDARGHLNFIEDAINDIRERSLKTLRMDGPLSIQDALASLIRDCIRLQDELAVSDSLVIGPKV